MPILRFRDQGKTKTRTAGDWGWTVVSEICARKQLDRPAREILGSMTITGNYPNGYLKTMEPHPTVFWIIPRPPPIEGDKLVAIPEQT